MTSYSAFTSDLPRNFLILLSVSSHSKKAFTDPLCQLLCSLRSVFTENSPASISTCGIIQEKLSTFSVDQLDSKYVHFDSHRYTRVLIAANKYFSLILNCWKKGQKTPLHNHGSYNVCSWVRVLQGKFFIEHEVENSNGETSMLIKTLQTNETLKVCEKTGDHIAGNASDDESCITLHLYWPPYLECCFEESHGISCTCNAEDRQKFIPLVHCNDRHHYFKDTEELETMALLRGRPLFGNVRKLVEVLRREIVIEPSGNHTPANIDHIKNFLESINLNEKEWQQYARFTAGRYTRNLIAYDEKFTILLLCWEKGQMSPIHDHSGSNCWVKVLDGMLEESVYDLGEDGVTTTIKSRECYGPGSVAYINDSYGVHKMGNPIKEEVTVSLHVYSPAYHECFIFSEESQTKKKVSISTAYGASYSFMEKNLESLKSHSCANAPETMQSFVQMLDGVFGTNNVCGFTVNEIVDNLCYSLPIWENYIHFSPDQYTRNLLGFTDNYSAMLACWCPNQQTPIHEHGESQERRVWVKVLTGTLQIQYFEEIFNQMVPSTKQPIVLKEGEFIMLRDAELGQHRTFNASASENCISLHIYSPPYVECSFIEQSGNEKCIPVAYCTNEINKFRAKLQEEDLEMECKFRPKVFSDFASFSNLINKYFEVDALEMDGDHLELEKIMSHVQFHPKEWKSRAVVCKESSGYTRNLVAYGYNYAVYLLCWKPKQGNPIHNHNQSMSCFKILEGSLVESKCSDPRQCGVGDIVPLTEVQLDENEVSCTILGDFHGLENRSDSMAYSLHVFSPPLEVCYGFNTETRTCCMYNCNHHFSPAAI